jgi:hypothetical protein
MKFVPETVASVMLSLEPPEFFRVTACFWLVPTETPPKLIVEGFTVSCPLAAEAGEVSANIAEKRKNERNPHEIPLHFVHKVFTARPLKPC